MKNILIIILIALVSYLVYLYWQKYNSNESFINDALASILNKKQNKSINKDKYKDLLRLEQEKGLLRLEKEQDNELINHNCHNGVCSIVQPNSHRPNSHRPNPHRVLSNNVFTKTQNKKNVPPIIENDFDVNTELNSEDNCVLTEGALQLVNEFVQSKNRQHVFMDIKINEEDIGRIVFELFDDIVPYTVDNFIFMCQNHYPGSVFHRIIKDFVIQGGDYINGNGTGSNSIYGKKFKDENFDLQHDSKYLLSMANSGPNTNGCQFFITLNNLPNLDNKHVVFGKVADDKSKLIVDRLGDVFTNNNDYPIVKCEIVNSGLLEDINQIN